MNHNLIPPFIWDEAGLEVDTKPKIHSKNLSVDSHSIFDTATELRIPLKHRGVFSYFNSRSLNSEEIHDLSPMIRYNWLLISPVGILLIPHGLSKRIHYLILMETFHLHWSENPTTLFLKMRLKYVHVKLCNKQLTMFFFPPVVGILREAMMMTRKNGSLLNIQ